MWPELDVIANITLTDHFLIWTADAVTIREGDLHRQLSSTNTRPAARQANTIIAEWSHLELEKQ